MASSKDSHSRIPTPFISRLYGYCSEKRFFDAVEGVKLGAVKNGRYYLAPLLYFGCTVFECKVLGGHVSWFNKDTFAILRGFGLIVRQLSAAHAF